MAKHAQIGAVVYARERDGTEVATLTPTAAGYLTCVLRACRSRERRRVPVFPGLCVPGFTCLGMIGYGRGPVRDPKYKAVDLPLETHKALKHEAVERAVPAKDIAELCIRMVLPALREYPTLPLAEVEALIASKLQAAPKPAALAAVDASEPAPAVIEAAAVIETPKPAKRVRAAMTVPERVAEAMGGGEWHVENLVRVLADSGDAAFKSNNLRAYVVGMMSNSKIKVPGPDGTDVEVRRFVQLASRRYRVATADEIQQEAQRTRSSG